MAKKTKIAGGMSGAYGDFINQTKPITKKAPVDPADIGRYFGGVAPMPISKTVPVNNVTDFSQYGNGTKTSTAGAMVGDYGDQYPAPVTPERPKETFLKVKSPVKIATPQYVNFNEGALDPITTSEYMSLFFDQINGQELLILSNKNFISSQTIQYQPISNMFNFKNQYNPKKIIALQNTSDTFFLNFAIRLDSKIPKGVSSSSTNGTNVYIDSNKNLVIETVNMAKDENVEIQILSGGTIYEDVI